MGDAWHRALRILDLVFSQQETFWGLALFLQSFNEVFAYFGLDVSVKLIERLHFNSWSASAFAQAIRLFETNVAIEPKAFQLFSQGTKNLFRPAFLAVLAFCADK